jgi:hypothetical protein
MYRWIAHHPFESYFLVHVRSVNKAGDHKESGWMVVVPVIGKTSSLMGHGERNCLETNTRYK